MFNPQPENRRVLRPIAGQWHEGTDRDYACVIAPHISIVPAAERYRRNNPGGEVVQEWNPQLVLYDFDDPNDPWDSGGWWEAFADRKAPLSPHALLRLYVRENLRAGVDLLWPSSREPGRPAGPVNPGEALGAWLPAEHEDERWRSPRAVWEETAGMTYPEIAAFCYAQCLLNDRYLESVGADLAMDMAGYNHLWSTWPAEQRGCQPWGDPTRYWERYASPVVDGSRAFFAKLEACLPDQLWQHFGWGWNAYGNGPIWGNLGQWAKNPKFAKAETYLDQGGIARYGELRADHFDRYWHGVKSDQHWPNWHFGIGWTQANIGAGYVTIARGFPSVEEQRRFWRWCIGGALLSDFGIGIQRSWTDYSLPTREECPEYWNWTERVVPTSPPERRTLRNGRVLWLRAYQEMDYPDRKKLLVVNPSRAEATADIPPEDAVFLDLWRLPLGQFMTWNAKLEGLGVRSLVSDPQPIAMGFLS